MSKTQRAKRTKVARAKTQTNRPYKIVITVIPAKRAATVRLRGKTVVLHNPIVGWEAEEPRRLEYRGHEILEPSRWRRFYVSGGVSKDSRS